MLELLLRDLDDKADPRTALLELARAALESERVYLMDAVEAQIDRAAERLDDQIKEKKQLVEFALKELENTAEETGGEVDANRAYRVVNDTLALQLRPSTDEVRAFDYRQFKKQITGWAEASVSARTRSSLALAIERRVGAGLGLNQSVKGDMDWDTVREQLLAAAEKAHANKAQKSLSEIERELKSLPDAPTRHQLLQTLIRMAYGTVTAFDQKTHKKIYLRTLRLTYVFLAAESVAEWKADELKEEINDHLQNAVEALREMWGEAEFQRQAMLRLSDLLPALRERVLAAIGPDVPESATLNALSPEAQQTVRAEIGRSVLTQLFRQIMLSVISQLWVEHLTSVEALRTSIGLEAYAQRDPLVMYKAKASEAFQQLLVNMRAGVVARAFTLRPRQQTEAPRPAPKERENGGRLPPKPEPKALGGRPSLAAQSPAQPTSEPQVEVADGGGKKKRRRR
jgi:preprotein translocase subunit SecA